MSAAPKPAAAKATQPPLDKRSRTVLILGIVLAVLGAAGLAATAWLNWPQPEPGAAILAQVRAADPSVQQTQSGLLYKVLQPGRAGGHPTDDDVALVTYTGRLTNGTVFDQSQTPVPMPVAGVVPGFSEALKLMNKGGRMRVWIKPSLGYGDRANGPIPANSVLVFDIGLVDFLPQSVVQQIQAMQQMQAAGGGNAAAPAGNAAAPR